MFGFLRRKPKKLSAAEIRIDALEKENNWDFDNLVEYYTLIKLAGLNTGYENGGYEFNMDILVVAEELIKLRMELKNLTKKVQELEFKNGN